MTNNNDMVKKAKMMALMKLMSGAHKAAPPVAAKAPMPPMRKPMPVINPAMAGAGNPPPVVPPIGGVPAGVIPPPGMAFGGAFPKIGELPGTGKVSKAPSMLPKQSAEGTNPSEPPLSTPKGMKESETKKLKPKA